MSLPPPDLPSIPVITADVARAAFPGGNVSLEMRDELGSLEKSWEEWNEKPK